MAGELRVDSLKASTGVLATQNGMNGIAKAWVMFQGGGDNTAGVVNNSFNVSSVTVTGTGGYLVNFTTPMPAVIYAVTTGLQRQGTYDMVQYIPSQSSVNSAKFESFVNGAGGNMAYIFASFFV